MKECAVLSFLTPKNYKLDGLWFGPQKADRGFIFIHGLSSTAFLHHDVLSPLVDSSTMALFFSNRGHDKITSIKKINDSPKGYERELAGEAHELFTDCVDDIQGAINLLLQKGVKEIYLVGHSTGCQKSIYYLSRANKNDSVKGAVLVCPISDYSFAVMSEDPATIKKAVTDAEKLVKHGKPHELLSTDLTEDLLDAQRYLSLYTPDSEEEIFTYSQPKKIPATLQKVKEPILVILAEDDEYGDRPAREIAHWFEDESKAQNLKVKILKDSTHNLKDKETETAELISNWLLSSQAQ